MESKPKKRDFPHWESLYQESPIEKMPWFYKDLDPDIKKALKDYQVPLGSCLDLGTGPGTQAVALASLGFIVTATDLSAKAIDLAQSKAQAQALKIQWQQDDFLKTQLKTSFDLVIDRGVFHIFEEEGRQQYLKNMQKLLKPGGYLFLKCFSKKETREEGPYRFNPEEIEAYFSPYFEILSIKETVYYGTLDPWPKALFMVMKRL
ncbi:MAG: class I SAM-dependent methyltransferase [Deltaproteobacteria bacterium]|nr:class I SAM-dependent methyltransferase [Deltaproteobacteria bacterium]